MNDSSSLEYDERIWAAKTEIILAKRAVTGLRTSFWFLIGAGIALVVGAFFIHSFMAFLAVMCAYGALKADQALRESIKQLKHWEDEYFLWATAQGFARTDGEPILED